MRLVTVLAVTSEAVRRETPGNIGLPRRGLVKETQAETPMTRVDKTVKRKLGAIGCAPFAYTPKAF